MKMRKMVAMLMAVMMLCCIIPFSVAAADSSATIDFTDKANRTAYSTAQQVWEQNGITVTNDKGASTSNVGDYANPGRFYKSSTVTIAYPGMTAIVINCDGLEAKYVDGWTNSFSADAEATSDGNTVTITLAGAADSFTWETLSAQSRAYSITVYTNGEAPIVPDQPDTPDVPSEDPEADTELTIADAIALGLSKEHNAYTEGKYFVTGVITEVYNTQYGNMYITDGNGNTLTIYGTYSADGADRYDAMDVKPVAGDTVTVYGIVGQYNGVAQIKNGWIVEHIIGDGTGEGGETPDVPVEPSDEIETDYPFLFGMTQLNVSEEDVYFLAGGMDGYYMATTTDPDAAIVVYVEATEGGYYFYTADEKGTKTYINMVVSGTHVNGAYEATASTVYRYDADYGTLIANVDGADYWFATRNDMSYTTMGPCKVEYEGFYGEFYYFEEDPPVDSCEHEYDNACDADCNLCGEWREVGDHVYDDEYDADCNECGDIREVDQPGQPDAPVSNSADFNTIVTSGASGGDSGYSKTYTTTNGWTTVNSAIQAGGTADSNPQFTVVGPDNTYKAVCLNGKVGAAGMIISPVLTGGISKLTVDYTKMFTDTMLSATITITDLATGATYTHTIAREEAKDTKYVVWTDEWVLETPVTGDFTIEIVNDCPSNNSSSNKDRMTILAVEWESAADVSACEHVYDDDYDADCNLCGEIREVPDKPIETDADIVVSTVNGAAGSTVQVTVSMVNNPGIVSAKVKVHFDNTVLKFASYEAGNFAIGGYSWSDDTVANENGYFIINWCDAIHPDSTADLLATLTFEVLADAAEGFTAITAEFSCENDMFNANDDTVWFNAVDGGVAIINVIYGDANGDGKVNNRDLGLLQQYLNGYAVEPNLDACDVNGDGKVNNRDLGLLQQYLNGYDVDLG